MTPLRLALAYGLDMLAGDPEWFPHPVRAFGAMIEHGETLLRRWCGTPTSEICGGAVLTAVVTAVACSMGWPSNAAWQVLLTWTTLATRNLLDEAGSVIGALDAGDLDAARVRLARIVGRDTGQLDESEIARALIETLAESSCDGIVAPLFWLAVGGLPMALAYKAVNTLDSMVGHPEPPYRYFGRVPARVDDIANFAPARIAALAIAASAGIHGLDARRSLVVWRRDGSLHASPNAGQGEAAMAGALGVRLGGTNSYEGRPHAAPVLHVEGRAPSPADAKTAVTLVATASALAFGAALLMTAWRRGR
jgi:adenosylcobinamide-phosphate synthase